uniref:Proton-coupled folate transporter n=1 Tax=Thelazia callipaeda TaxID=103827 RepID=A0A0N5CRC6_THECL
LQFNDQIGINCSDHLTSSSNPELQKIANWILLLRYSLLTYLNYSIYLIFFSISHCSFGVIASALIGRIGDVKSRKLALIIPFTGLILEGRIVIIQRFHDFLTNHFQLSVYWLIASEGIFAIFGGYMSIFSSFFAYATESVNNYPAKCRSQVIAILEGIIGLGGTVGYLCSFILKLLGFTGIFTIFLVIYLICLLFLVFIIPSVNYHNRNTEQEFRKDIFGFELFVSDFIFVNKYSNFQVLLVYPFLRKHNVSDRALSLLGLISRALGRLWLAITWSTPATFMRKQNIISGSMFALFAITEAICNLLASVTFHTLYPLTLHFLPQLSFYILAASMLIPILILWYVFDMIHS